MLFRRHVLRLGIRRHRRDFEGGSKIDLIDQSMASRAGKISPDIGPSMVKASVSKSAKS